MTFPCERRKGWYNREHADRATPASRTGRWRLDNGKVLRVVGMAATMLSDRGPDDAINRRILAGVVNKQADQAILHMKTLESRE